jgi:hypothetical protein
MRAPIDRLDSWLIAALAGVTGADRAARLVAQVADPESLAATVRRFVEVEVFRFHFDGGSVYVTVTDFIALSTAAIVLIRFGAWIVAPLFGLIVRGVRHARRP